MNEAARQSEEPSGARVYRLPLPPTRSRRRLLLLFVAAVVALLAGLALLAARSPFSVPLIAFAIVAVFVTSFVKRKERNTP